MFPIATLIVLMFSIVSSVFGAGGEERAGLGAVEFNRDIRPIFSDTCFTCHGPDKANRKTEMRLDTPEGAFANLGNYRALVPGDLGKSEVYRRLISEDEAVRMPPAYFGRKLTPQQIELVKRWIEQGAKWQKHWSLIAPKRPELPVVKQAGWTRNAVDFFVQNRLEREGLKPSPDADPTTLIRRVTLDLTGLPPTLAEVDAFLADKSPNAYEKVVDRLLQSPRYGERMAIRWLDGARYADTNGYQTDAERTMWRWRDWVIEAFNRNLPFDQFTIEQLAGDLLPHATLEQKLATGFNRNHRGNGEGGIIPQEYAVEYVVDRVETTTTVWLGLTMGCARCHDHKYDPLTQKEFYQLFAFFNNVPERGNAFKYGNSPPFVLTPTKEQQKEVEVIEQKLAAAETQLKALKPQIATAQTLWEKGLNKAQPLHWATDDGLVAYFPLDANTAERASQAAGSKPLNAQFVDGELEYAPGQIGLAASFDGKRFIEAGDIGSFGFYDRLSLGAWVFPKGSKGGAILSRTKEVPQEGGYTLSLADGKVNLILAARWLDDALKVETEQPLTENRWHHVMATYDGSRLASGLRVYVDGKVQPLKILLDGLNQDFRSPDPLRIGSGGGPDSRFQGEIDEVRLYHRTLSAEEVKLEANTDSITAIAALPPSQRNDVQSAKMQACFLEKYAPEPIEQAREQLMELRKQKQVAIDHIPTTMVMQEMKAPRETFLLQRGAYDPPGEKVEASVPASLPPMPASLPRNRLGLARWLMDPANPLTARVAVNRYWQMLFGMGLVKTVEDFGSQGESPAHPELLDWLATEFVRTGWNVKGMLKTIVTSATYRQSSRVTPELIQKDPDNRLLARGPRVRLSAEIVRDQALAISGLLVGRVGGPSVKPYQPAGLWKDLSGAEDYQPDRGENLYRRGIYTFWKRSVAPPMMLNFDSAAREACVVRDTRTNTPLQALNLMNDVTFVEASRVLAQRVLSEAGPSPEERLERIFRLATARRPQPSEQKILLAGLQHHLETYHKDLKAAVRLVGTGEFPVNEKLDVCELAAYTTMASLILNFDEVISKE